MTPIVAFSPPGCTATLLLEYEKAKRCIYIQAYSFTSAAIALALIAAKGRGVIVNVILDAGDVSGKGTQYDTLVTSGIPVAIDRAHAIAHNKISLIDDWIVCTGSFNYTNAAEHSNAENLVVYRDPVMYAKYLNNWRLHRDHSGLAIAKGRYTLGDLPHAEEHQMVDGGLHLVGTGVLSDIRR